MHLIKKYVCTGCAAKNILNPVKKVNEIAQCKKCKFKQKLTIRDYNAPVNQESKGKLKSKKKPTSEPPNEEKQVIHETQCYFELHHVSHVAHSEQNPVKFNLITGVTTVGRRGKSADIEVDDTTQTMSRLHFKITIHVTSNGIMATLEDMQSLDGTYLVVNDVDKKLNNRIIPKIEDQMIIKAGTQVFKIVATENYFTFANSDKENSKTKIRNL